MIRGWIDHRTGEACAVVGTRAFVGTFEQFVERCERMDASFVLFCHEHRKFQPCPDCPVAGWDANGSPVE